MSVKRLLESAPSEPEAEERTWTVVEAAFAELPVREQMLFIERLMRRNNLSREEAAGRIAAQMPQEEKMRYADFLIDTSEDYEQTRQRTLEVFRKLKALSETQAHRDS